MAIENDTSDKLITLDNLAVFQEEIDARKQDTLLPDSALSIASLSTSGNVSVGGSITKGGKAVATEEYVYNLIISAINANY